MPKRNHTTIDDQPEDDLWSALLTPVNRLNADLRVAARTLGDDEARHLVHAYYTMQDDRKRTAAQSAELEKTGQPHSVLNWMFDQSSTLEAQIKVALDGYTQAHVMGSWMRQIYGIGPVISAGLLAHIYMGIWCAECHGRNPDDCIRRQADKKRKLAPHAWQPEESVPTVGHIWQFMGWAADGQTPWEKGQKRPFNADLKTLGWKVGQSFMKFSNQPQCYYGKVYPERKTLEIERNESLNFKDQALIKAAKVGRGTEAYKYYSIGKLPPAHIDARARRYAVKLFLSHLHGEWYQRQFNKPAPAPYPIAFLGHAHLIPAPV